MTSEFSHPWLLTSTCARALLSPRPCAVFAFALWSLAVASTQAEGQGAALFAGTPFSGYRAEVVGQALGLGFIMDVAVTPDGTVLVLDRSNSKVLRVTSRGVLTQTYGGPGDGPGEFRFPYCVTELTDGTVLVFDAGNGRFSQFERNGEFRRRWAPNTDIVSITDIAPLRNGGFVISGIVRDPRAVARAVHVFDSTFQLVRSFGDLPRARSRALQETRGSGSLRRSSTGELVYARLIPYELHWYDEQGVTRRSVSIPKRVVRLVDDLYDVSVAGQKTVTKMSPKQPYAGPASELPDGRVISNRIEDGSVFWDILDRKGQLLWSGKKPPLIGGFVGADSSTSALWFTGETGSGEPVLYRVVIAAK